MEQAEKNVQETKEILLKSINFAMGVGVDSAEPFERMFNNKVRLAFYNMRKKTLKILNDSKAGLTRHALVKSVDDLLLEEYIPTSIPMMRAMYNTPVMASSMASDCVMVVAGVMSP